MSTTPITATTADNGRLEWRRIARENRTFLILLAIGLLLRVSTQVLYWPSILQWIDAVRYLRVSPHGFFADDYAPAGYPAFLRAIFFFTSNLGVTVFAQHILGLITGTLLYAMVKRVTGIAWLGCIPAGIVFLSGDYLLMEHILMSDTLFATLATFGVYAALRALDDSRPRLWLALSGLGMIAAALARPITLEVPLVIAVWAVFALGGPWRKRALDAVAAVVPGGLLLAGYLVIASAIGPHTGINEMTGWDLYSRVAPFADCSKFTPPAGTAKLCEHSSPDERPGPQYYSWVPNSPALYYFPLTPRGGKKPGEFAKAAIEAQPFDYLKAVAKDMARYVDPEIGHEKQYAGIPYSLYQFDTETPGEEQTIGEAIESRGYTGVLPTHKHWIGALVAYQAVFHVGGLPVLLMAVFALAGIVLARGRRRWAAILTALVASLMYLLPVLTLTYEIRYSWPATPLLCVAAVIGALAVFERWVARPRGTVAAAADV